MGLWGAFKSFCSTVKEKVSDTFEYGKGQVQAGITYAKEKTSNIVANFTGKTDFEKAKKLHKDITEAFRRKQKEYDEKVSKLVELIDQEVNKINTMKKKINNELFVSFAQKIEKLADVEIIGAEVIESFTHQNIKIDKVRGKEDLFLIDFDKNKISTTLLSIFTLGFATRKKAKETLAKVREEECRLQEEYKKLDAEIVRLEKILDSVKNIALYFEELVNIFERLLQRMDNSINYLVFNYMTKLLSFKNGKMSVKYLPKAQQEELRAVVTVSNILGQMTRLSFICEESEVKKASLDFSRSNKNVKILYKAV